MGDKMTGIKGFDKDLKCRGLQFGFGKESKVEGELILCKRGIHYVNEPLDAFSYYPPATSRYAEVEAEGVSDEIGDDSKRVCSSLVVKVELSFKAMAQAAVSFVSSKVKASKETQATAGFKAHAATAGRDSIAVSLGVLVSSKAAKGSWIVCAEWKQNADYSWSVVGVKTAKVDGKRIKADTFYVLKCGKFVGAK